MGLKLDIETDFAEVLRRRLAAAGYPAIAGETDESTIRRYLNVLNRKIEPKPRRTVKSSTFICPPGYEAGLAALIATSEAGGDLRPYQSTGVENDNYDDGMLNAWAVHHFHLGTTPHPRFPGFVARTGPLLYAAVTDGTLFCLAILAHNEWSNQQLLELMDRDFPELLASSTMENDTLKPTGLAVHYTDEEIQKLRNAGINAITQQPSGRITASPGGGVNLSRDKGRKSMKVTRATIDVRKYLGEVEAEINRQAEAAGVPHGHEARLIEKDGKLIVTDAHGALTVEIDTPIVRQL